MSLRIPALVLATTLAATIAAPIVASAAMAPREAASIQIRFFDRSHRDYHVWNDSEDRSYRQYLIERHRRYLAFQRQRRAEQTAYWRWRHVHGD